MGESEGCKKNSRERRTLLDLLLLCLTPLTIVLL